MISSGISEHLKIANEIIFVQRKRRQTLRASGGTIVALLKLRLRSIDSMSIRDSIDILLLKSMFTIKTRKKPEQQPLAKRYFQILGNQCKSRSTGNGLMLCS